jgi:hypothetical protein
MDVSIRLKNKFTPLPTYWASFTIYIIAIHSATVIHPSRSVLALAITRPLFLSPLMNSYGVDNPSVDNAGPASVLFFRGKLR